MKKINHSQEITETRRGGFGGSDAALFHKIATKGIESLTATDLKRIAVAKGVAEYNPISPTPAMKLGHAFEDWFAEQSFSPIAQREGVISKVITDKFKTFAHADFIDQHKENNFSFAEVWELKCVADPAAAEKTYYSQLQWYYLLDADIVHLVAQDSGAEFGLGSMVIETIERDDDYIATLLAGVKILAENWDGILLPQGCEVMKSELLPYEQDAAEKLAELFVQAGEIETRMAEIKEGIKKIMEANNITSIKSDYYSISYVGESVTSTLDKKKLFADNPTIKEGDYLKQSKRKSFITIKLK